MTLLRTTSLGNLPRATSFENLPRATSLENLSTAGASSRTISFSIPSRTLPTTERTRSNTILDTVARIKDNSSTLLNQKLKTLLDEVKMDRQMASSLPTTYSKIEELADILRKTTVLLSNKTEDDPEFANLCATIESAKILQHEYENFYSFSLQLARSKSTPAEEAQLKRLDEYLNHANKFIMNVRSLNPLDETGFRFLLTDEPNPKEAIASLLHNMRSIFEARKMDNPPPELLSNVNFLLSELSDKNSDDLVNPSVETLRQFRNFLQSIGENKPISSQFGIDGNNANQQTQAVRQEIKSLVPKLRDHLDNKEVTWSNSLPSTIPNFNSVPSGTLTFKYNKQCNNIQIQGIVAAGREVTVNISQPGDATSIQITSKPLPLHQEELNALLAGLQNLLR